VISGSDISLSFGGRHLFDGVSFRIGPHDRIGLVGSNGAGKTTLLKLLLGEQSSDSGEVAKAKFVSVGYLPQDGMSALGKSLYKEVESVFDDILSVQRELDLVHTQMGEVEPTTDDFAELLEIYGELQHKLENSDAFVLKSRIEKILMGLGFSTGDLDRMTDEFSGGWQMRIALAKLLLQQPSLLLLDEPTNHLDLDSLQWLEEYLHSYEGAVMIVSHDRRFLDTMTTRIFELSLGTLTEYHGNYTAYLVAREERKAQTKAAMENQQQQIKQTEQFIERFRYKATKARQVQSRIKMLEKIDLIEMEDEEEAIRFRFPPAPQSGRSVLELRSISKSYGTNKVFANLDFDIDRGDRMAFVGVNGAGKSTLSRIIAGVEGFDGGARIPGHNVIVSYFAQHQAEELDPKDEVLAVVDKVATGEIRKRLRTLLGSFLFRGDDVFKKVKVLSGGEKSRLALAKMLLQPSNLLILDEPTNHLDMRSKGVLQEALKSFEGSFVIVSHDRDFLEPLVNKVIEFRHGIPKTYLGGISDYLYKLKQQVAIAKHQATTGANASRSEKDRKRAEAEERQKRYKVTKPVQQKIKAVEKSIELKESRKKELEALLADPEIYKEGERVKQIHSEFKSLDQELASDYFRWNDLIRELERISGELGND